MGVGEAQAALDHYMMQKQDEELRGIPRKEFPHRHAPHRPYTRRLGAGAMSKNASLAGTRVGYKDRG